MSSFDDTAWLLEQWGRWAYINRGMNLGYSGIQPYTRQVASTASPNIVISDLVASEIDHTVAKLCRLDPEMGRALALYYLRGWSYRKLAEKLGMPRAKVTVLVKTGVGWVSDTLDSE